MEAGTGIEPVFTDLQSNGNRTDNNRLGSKKSHDKGRTLGERGTGRTTARSLLSQYMKPEHKRMSRMLGCCLTLDTPEAWAGFRFVSQVRMSEGERAMLAYFALTSLKPESSELTAAAAMRSAGEPRPVFLGGMEVARSWAVEASSNELKAYALACFEAMTAKDQAAFFQYISSIEVAA